MTREEEEAIKNLKSKMDGSVDTSYEWAETVRMAIEALKAPTKSTNTPTDTPTGFISRRDAVNEIHKYFWEEIEKTPTEIDEDGDELYADMPTVNSLLACNKELSKRIKSLPSAEQKTKCIAQIKVDRDDIEDMVNEMAKEIAEPKMGRDCTDFVRWLMDEVLDEENWQWNAVANGEIICRKLKKLGLIDVVDGYYVETQETGWIPVSEMLPKEDGVYLATCDGEICGEDEPISSMAEFEKMEDGEA